MKALTDGIMHFYYVVVSSLYRAVGMQRWYSHEHADVRLSNA